MIISANKSVSWIILHSGFISKAGNPFGFYWVDQRTTVENFDSKSFIPEKDNFRPDNGRLRHASSNAKDLSS